MVELGKYNELEIVRLSKIGFYLDGGDWGEILYPNKYIVEGMEVGDTITALLYQDSEGRPVATSEKAYALVGSFAFLRVTHANDFGAFMDWGVNKELFVPFAEQAVQMRPDSSYVVYLFEDLLSNRIVASSKLNKFLDDTSDADLKMSDGVSILIWKETDLGYKAIINNSLEGIIYKNEIFSDIKIGDTVDAYIKKIRPDGKIDLSLSPLGHGKIDSFAGQVLLKMSLNGGHLGLNDKSSPEAIMKELQMSKKNFKKAVGQLYKERKITIKDDGIHIME